jgi:hypothetical protein
LPFGSVVAAGAQVAPPPASTSTSGVASTSSSPGVPSSGGAAGAEPDVQARRNNGVWLHVALHIKPRARANLLNPGALRRRLRVPTDSRVRVPQVSELGVDPIRATGGDRLSGPAGDPPGLGSPGQLDRRLLRRRAVVVAVEPMWRST